jgi:hypothetical protein
MQSLAKKATPYNSKPSHNSQATPLNAPDEYEASSKHKNHHKQQNDQWATNRSSQIFKEDILSSLSASVAIETNSGSNQRQIHKQQQANNRPVITSNENNANSNQRQQQPQQPQQHHHTKSEMGNGSF